ncbi:VOC family protein [Paenibacillus ehimensis]|uniref:VOC family protein n=1 Tax=Paenibacillus ehimensis TaxID=79264 RepID=A0ABT8VDD5_9BACL|nr:VOC family protein [Paenibacillus ehimensis]MDO3678994.1 VOC family protein [Paenibacillus ehimensis]MEC0209953.1 VOC family protein [Paenibacillus ehimensis]
MKANLTPFISSQDARSQAEFYSHALGGEIQSTITFGEIPGTPEENKDKVMYMAMTVAGGNDLFLSDSFGPVSTGGGIAFALSFDDEAEAREAYANLGKGGTDKYPFVMQPWGAYYGEVVDKFGITWQIVKQGK